MSDPNRLAVVIPVYNHARYLGFALDSVLAQTRKPDRILVLDDGSSDDSVAVARSYEDRGVEVDTQENAGAHYALNRLVAKAATDCGTIAILNSDDIYLPARLEACMVALDTDPAATMVVSPIVLIDDNGKPLPAEHPRAGWFGSVWSVGFEDGVSLASWLGLANFPATTSNIVARADYLLANPMRDYRYCHDYFLLASAAVEGGLRVLSGDSLLQYRVHQSNTMNTSPEHLIREMVRMRMELARHLAPVAAADADVRARLADFLQACWGNVSSITESEVQLALASALDDEQIAKAVESIPAERLAGFPNRAMVNARTEGHPLGRGPELARRVELLTSDKANLQGREKAFRDLALIRHRLESSRWVALGTLLGQVRGVHKNDGKSPDDKATALRWALAESWWLRFGSKLGSRSCRELLALVHQA